MLTVTTEQFGDVVTLRCRGRIVRGQETAILCAAVAQQGRNLVLNLSGVDAIDAAGIGLLVSLQAAGIYLKLVNPTTQVREILSVTQLESVFEICEAQSMEASTESMQAGVQENQLERLQASFGLNS
jgi:anti-anti-sigma factor